MKVPVLLFSVINYTLIETITCNITKNLLHTRMYSYFIQLPYLKIVQEVKYFAAK